MKQAAEHRQHAGVCRKLAQTARTTRERGQFMSLAEAWERMAGARARGDGRHRGEPPPRDEPPLGMEDWPTMSTAVRVQYCRLMAEDGVLGASNASIELKEGYLRIAAYWLELATEIERTGRD